MPNENTFRISANCFSWFQFINATNSFRISLRNEPNLIKIGIWCFALVLLFQVVTLPVEFNASHRALRMLNNGAILSPQEMQWPVKSYLQQL